MRREPMILLLSVFVSFCTVGNVARRICPGTSPECEAAGLVDGVEYNIHPTTVRTKTKDVEVEYRTYFCDGAETLNIPRKEKFECCHYRNEDRSRWRRRNNIRFFAGNDTLKCEAKVQCSAPPDPVTNMKRTVVTRYMTQGGKTYYDGDTIKYKCKEGYELTSNNTDNLMSNNSDYGWDVYYHDEPAEANLTSGIRCTSDGQWVDAETNSEEITLGICAEILCDASRFENMTNGEILNYTAIYEYGAYLELVCSEGYRASDGLDTVMCETSGSFSETNLENFKCEAIRCPIPPHVENGNAYGVDREINGTVTFGCDTGYTLSGQKTWRCKDNGEWDGYCVRCNRKDTYCPAPCVPEGAMLLTPEQTYHEGAVIKFECELNITFGGSPERVCLKNRQWSGDDIDCLGRTSRSPVVSNLLNALHNVSLLGNKTVGSIEMSGKTIDINQPGGVDVFLLVDTSGSISDDEFEATKNFITALLPMLNINTADTGTRLALYMFATDVHEVANDHSLLLPFRDEEDWGKLIKKLTKNVIQDKTSKTEQREKGTAFEAGLYRIKREIQTKAIKWEKKELRVAQQVLIIISDGIDNMGGDPKKSADELKSKHRVETYSICVQPAKKKRNAGIEFMKSLASPEERDHFFLLSSDSGDGYLNSIVELMINEAPACSDCGCTFPLRTQVKNATNQYHSDAIRHAWPWMAQLRKRNGLHLCGGSVIDNKWILTAAHCFLGKADTLDSIALKKLKLDDDVNNEIINIRKENVFIHEKYDENKKQKFLYDIALVYIGRDRAISFDNELHAICLSASNDSTYDKYLEKSRYGIATGWGKTGENTEFSNHLKQMQMMVQLDDTCFKSLGQNAKKKYDSTLMFCAGGKDDTGKAIDTCKGDSGGPFVVPYDEDVPDKTDRFLQIGIVSSGYGACLQDGTYGLYTKLTPKLLKWIEDTKAKKEKV